MAPRQPRCSDGTAGVAHARNHVGRQECRPRHADAPGLEHQLVLIGRPLGGSPDAFGRVGSNGHALRRLAHGHRLGRGRTPGHAWRHCRSAHPDRGRLAAPGTPHRIWRAGRIRAHDGAAGGAVRDLWDLNDRLRADLGVRIDWNSFVQEAVSSPRAGLKYAVDRQRGHGRQAGRGPVRRPRTARRPRVRIVSGAD